MTRDILNSTIGTHLYQTNLQNNSIALLREAVFSQEKACSTLHIDAAKKPTAVSCTLAFQLVFLGLKL